MVIRILQTVLLYLLFLSFFGSTLSFAEIRANFRNLETPGEFLASHKDEGIYVVSIRQAQLAQGDRADHCTVDYVVEVSEILSGPDFQLLTFCSDGSLNIGSSYLVFLVRFKTSSELAGIVRYSDAFPILKNYKEQSRPLVEIPSAYIKFPEELIVRRYTRSVEYPNGDKDKTQYVQVDWLKLLEYTGLKKSKLS